MSRSETCRLGTSGRIGPFYRIDLMPRCSGRHRLDVETFEVAKRTKHEQVSRHATRLARLRFVLVFGPFRGGGAAQL